MADLTSLRDDTSLSDLNLSMASSADISMVGMGYEDMTFTEEHNDSRYFNKELRESLSTVKSLLKNYENAGISTIMHHFFKDAVLEVVHSKKYLNGILKEKFRMRYQAILIKEKLKLNHNSAALIELAVNEMLSTSTFTDTESRTIRDIIMKIVLKRCKTIIEINDSFRSDMLPDTTVKPGNILSDDKINLMNEMDEWKAENDKFKEDLEKCNELSSSIEKARISKMRGITDEVEDIKQHIGNLAIECRFLDHKIEVSANDDDNENSLSSALDKLYAFKKDELEKKMYKFNKLTKKRNKYLMLGEEYIKLQKEFDESTSELKKVRQVLRSLQDE